MGSLRNLLKIFLGDLTSNKLAIFLFNIRFENILSKRLILCGDFINRVNLVYSAFFT